MTTFIQLVALVISIVIITLVVKWQVDDEIDTSRFIIGNCFKTKEEAEAIAEKFKKLLKDSYEKTKEKS